MFRFGYMLPEICSGDKEFIFICNFETLVVRCMKHGACNSEEWNPVESLQKDSLKASIDEDNYQ